MCRCTPDRETCQGCATPLMDWCPAHDRYLSQCAREDAEVHPEYFQPDAHSPFVNVQEIWNRLTNTYRRIVKDESGAILSDRTVPMDAGIPIDADHFEIVRRHTHG